MLNIYDYITDSRFFKTFKVDDLLFVEYKCGFKGDSISYWTHNNYFAFVLSGRTKYWSGKHEYVVNEGDAIFVKKGTYIADRNGGGDYCALIIFLPDDFIKTILDKHIVPIRSSEARERRGEDSIFIMNMDEALSAYFHSVLSYFTRDISPSRDLLKIKFEELLLNIVTGQQNQSLAAALREIHQTGKVSIRQVMESSFMHNMSLEEYARLCARSLSTFKADFFETFGCTPGKWLIGARLQYAKRLLETTGDSVNDVAFKSGFKNTTHFVRVFKEMNGMPPLQYRQSIAQAHQKVDAYSVE